MPPPAPFPTVPLPGKWGATGAVPQSRGEVIGGSMVLEGDAPPGMMSTAFPPMHAEVVGGSMILEGDVAPGSYASPFPPSPEGIRPSLGIRRAFWIILFLIMVLLMGQRLLEEQGSISFEIVVYGLVALAALRGALKSDAV